MSEKRRRNLIKPLILVVEDDVSSLEYMLFFLKKLDIDVITAKTGEEALIVVKDKSVDCMLLDTYLGSGMSGIALMEVFRRQEKFVETPIIVVSPDYGGDLKEFIQLGFTDTLAKPYNYENLRRILEKYISIQDRGSGYACDQ